VRIIIDGRADATALGRHLERFGCRVVELRPRGLLLELPNAPDRANAEAEAKLYLAMWHESHPRQGDAWLARQRQGEPAGTPDYR
jgi:hypothetical protein